MEGFLRDLFRFLPTVGAQPHGQAPGGLFRTRKAGPKPPDMRIAVSRGKTTAKGLLLPGERNSIEPTAARRLPWRLQAAR